MIPSQYARSVLPVKVFIKFFVRNNLNTRIMIHFIPIIRALA